MSKTRGRTINASVRFSERVPMPWFYAVLKLRCNPMTSLSVYYYLVLFSCDTNVQLVILVPSEYVHTQKCSAYFQGTSDFVSFGLNFSPSNYLPASKCPRRRPVQRLRGRSRAVRWETRWTESCTNRSRWLALRKLLPPRSRRRWGQMLCSCRWNSISEKNHRIARLGRVDFSRSEILVQRRNPLDLHFPTTLHRKRLKKNSKGYRASGRLLLLPSEQSSCSTSAHGLPRVSPETETGQSRNH